MADASVKPRPPPPFAITLQTRLEDWKNWQKSYRCYANAVNLNKKSHDVQLSTFKSLVGSDALEIYATFSIAETVDVESVMRKFDEHFKPQVNLTLERYKLYRLSQKPGQNFDEFLFDIINQVDRCEFESERDDIILYKIVGGTEDEELRKVLLAHSKLTYDDAIQIGRASASHHFMSRTENHARPSSRNFELAEKTQKATDSVNELQTKQAERKPANGNTRKSRKDRGEGFSQKILKEEITKPEDDELKMNEGRQNERESSNEDDSSRGGGDSDWRADDHEEDVVRTHGVRRFPCDVCGKVLTRKRALNRHVLIHVPNDNFTCFHCGGKFRLKYYLLRHMSRTHPETVGSAPKVYRCDVCNYTTTVGPNLRRHKFQHVDDKPFACQMCDYKCIVRQLMKAHMAKHTGERPFACGVCHKGFTESGSLKKHLVKHMSPEEKERHRAAQTKRFVEAVPRDTPAEAKTCETCGKSFCSKAALKAHTVIHSGEKPFACNICDYRSAHRSALMTHMNTKHSVDKPFVCNVCGYACKLKSALQCHMNIHSGDRPFACKLCDSKFKQSAHLSVHMRTHTGEKPFVCDICGHRWANQSNLRQHMKIHQNQSGDPSQYSPPRKRRKIPKNTDPPGEPSAPNNVIAPQWSEQVSSINPMECFPGVETPSPFQPYAHQGNARPPDCRFYEQRQWPIEDQVLHNPIDSRPVAILSSTQPDS